MERARVEEAIAQLEADGKTVSANAIVALIGGSKRDVLAHLKDMRVLAGVGTGLEEPDDDEEQAEEERYHHDVAQLEAALQAAEEAYDTSEQAVWAQAHRYAAVQAIDGLGGFLRRETPPPSEPCERRWRATPAREQGVLGRLIEERKTALWTIENRRRALTQRHQDWQRAQAHKAFLASPEGQVLQRELEGILAAYTVAKAANQDHMVRELAIKRDRMQARIASGGY